MNKIENFLEEYVFNTGIRLSEARKIYKQAILESKSFQKEDDLDFIKKIMNNLNSNKSLFIENFMKSKFKNLSEFIDYILDEEIMSTGFSASVKPEHSLDVKNKDEENEEEEK